MSSLRRSRNIQSYLSQARDRPHRASSHQNRGCLSKEGSGYSNRLGWKTKATTGVLATLIRQQQLALSQWGPAPFTTARCTILHTPDPVSAHYHYSVSHWPFTEGGGWLDVTSKLQIHVNNSKDSSPQSSSKEFLWKCRTDLLTIILVFCTLNPLSFPSQ